MIVFNQRLVSKYLVGDPGEKDGKGNLELSNKKLSELLLKWLFCQRNNRKLTTKTVLPTFVRETVTFVATMRLERHTRREGWSAKGTPWVRTLCSAWASDINVASQKNHDRIFGDNYILDPFPII